jgi:copper chaperone
MEKTVLNVQGMSCSHCENRVKKAVSTLIGVSSVSVSLSEKTVTVEFDPDVITVKQIKEEIKEQGYDVK